MTEDKIQTKKKEKEQGKAGTKLSPPTRKNAKFIKPLKTATNTKIADNVKMVVIESSLSHTFSKRNRKVCLSTTREKLLGKRAVFNCAPNCS